MNDINITHLLLGGGGLAGFEMLGIMHGLQWRGLARGVRHISSISIGTYFAAFFMMDADAMVTCSNLMTCLSPSALHITPFDIFKLPYTYHLVKIAPFMEPLKKAMRARWPEVAQPETMTFGEFCQRCNREWSIIMTNLSSSRPVIALGTGAPFADVPVLDLICASMGLPFILPPKLIKGEFYVDGGLTCDNPFIAYNSTKLEYDTTLQIVIAEEPHAKFQLHNGSGGTKIHSIGHYIQQLMNCGMWHKSAYIMRATSHVITLHDCVMPLLPLRITKRGLWIDITPEKIEAALIHGLDLFEKWHATASPSSPPP